jgi:TonB family protein
VHRLLALLLCAAAPGAVSTASTRTDRRGPAAAAAASVVKVFRKLPDGTVTPAGSGFVVAKGLVATSRGHEAGTHFVMTSASPALVPVTFVPSAQGSDVDLLRAELPGVAPLRLARRTPRVGEAVVVVGTAVFGARTVAGTVMRPAAPSAAPIDDARLHEISAPVAYENVGAPLLAVTGDVLGLVATTSVRDGGPVATVVPADAVAARVAEKPAPAAPAPVAAPVAKETPPAAPTDGRDARPVAQKAAIENRPRPVYTEQARQNRTEGNVVVKVLLGANGKVRQASVVRGLPDGLNEKAIEAAYQLKFTPAKNAAGEPIDSWVTVSVNFTIRTDPVDGAWAGTLEGGGEIQFLLAGDLEGHVVGLAIVGTGPGSYACLPVAGQRTLTNVRIHVTGQLGCALEWSGTVTSDALDGAPTAACPSAPGGAGRRFTAARRTSAAPPRGPGRA